MARVKSYLKLIRVKHYIKNGLVFLPMFFGGVLWEKQRIMHALFGFIIFSLISSVVYIINDLRDIEKDRNHPKKKNRPLASGSIDSRSAIIVAVIFVVIAIICSCFIENKYALICPVLYLLLNILYSVRLKNIPIVDVVILASGFVLRVFFGGMITGVEISKWLYLVVVTGSLYMGLGKRRNELRAQTDTREVLKFYNESFLNKYMMVCVALVNVFYALWSMEMPNPRMIWTVPFFLVLIMCYSMVIEGDSDGDPIEVIFQNKILIVFVIIYAICIFSLLYLFK